MSKQKPSWKTVGFTFHFKKIPKNIVVNTLINTLLRCDDYSVRYYCASDLNRQYSNSTSIFKSGWTESIQVTSESMTLSAIMDSFAQQETIYKKRAIKPRLVSTYIRYILYITKKGNLCLFCSICCGLRLPEYTKYQQRGFGSEWI